MKSRIWPRWAPRSFDLKGSADVAFNLFNGNGSGERRKKRVPVSKIK